MYMSLLTGKNTPNFAKDTVYRFMKMVQINWMRFTTILDSMFERNRSKKVEQVAAFLYIDNLFLLYQPWGI